MLDVVAGRNVDGSMQFVKILVRALYIFNTSLIDLRG